MDDFRGQNVTPRHPAYNHGNIFTVQLWRDDHNI